MTEKEKERRSGWSGWSGRREGMVGVGEDLNSQKIFPYREASS
jgi:hypothetical protein